MKFSLALQRLKDESFEDYKARRKLINKRIKAWRKGRVFHNSSRDGVYRKVGTKEHIQYIKGSNSEVYRKVVSK